MSSEITRRGVRRREAPESRPVAVASARGPVRRGDGRFEPGAKRAVLGGQALATVVWFQTWKQNVLPADPEDSLVQVRTGDQRSGGLEMELAREVSRAWRAAIPRKTREKG